MTDQLGPDKSALLESLWDSYVFMSEDEKPQSRDEREDRALGMLQLLRRFLEEKPDDQRTRLTVATHGAVVLQLLVQRFAQDLFFEMSDGLVGRASCAGVSERRLLGWLLDLQDTAAPPAHRNAIDPMTIVLPREMFERLRNGMKALDQGEIHPIVQASQSGRHGPAWTRDEMQARALEHVSFLRGQGIVKDIARRRVANAMGMGSIETLKSWEKAGSDLRRHVFDLSGRLKAAEEAGRISIRGRRDGDDAHAFAFLLNIKAEPLAAFGKRYRQLFETRTLVKGGDHSPIAT